MPEFQVIRNGLQDRFLRSRAKVQIYGGGFANGKTSAACIKALQLADAYPGSNGLIARETRPKLADTIMKEFLKWCPKSDIKTFPRGQNSSNTCTMKNGTEINFRYIAQQKKGETEGTSNLLSATYDWIIIDQAEDPGIVEKDFNDLLGRLRGNTRYVGNDPTMPRTGPRWIVLTLNPTRNWVYRTLVRPLHVFQKTGRVVDELMCVRNIDTNQPILDDDGKPQLLIDLFEGSTYENKHNLGEDYIVTLASRYQGQMRDRYLLGLWAAYSGLIYGQHNDEVHAVSYRRIVEVLNRLYSGYKRINWIEGYDYGIAVPSCYGLAFVDPVGNVIVVDGFYKAEMEINEQAERIKVIRDRYGVHSDNRPYADPQIFRRGPGGNKVVGKTVAEMFTEEGIEMRRGNNNITNGIQKVSAHLNIAPMHRNPFNQSFGAPHLFYNADLDWITDEINEYVWKTDSKGDIEGDVPVDKNDHAMDMLKYMLSERPEPTVIEIPDDTEPFFFNQWSEAPDRTSTRMPQRH